MHLGHRRVIRHSTGNGSPNEREVNHLFHSFAERAYRREVTEGELGRYLQLFTKLESEGNTRQAAMQATYTAMLCSPDFIYIKPATGKTDQYALASRLSYFSGLPCRMRLSRNLARSGEAIEGG